MLLISVTTAFVHVVYQDLFQIKPPSFFMYLHQGRVSETIGWTRVPYVTLCLLSYLLMIGTGITMFKLPWKKEFWNINTSKKFHGLIGMILFAFLLVSAVTGFLYRFLRVVFKLDKNSVGWLLTIHAFKYTHLTTVCYVHFMLIMVALLIIGGSYNYFRSWYLWIRYKMFKRKDKDEDFDTYENMIEEGEIGSNEYPLQDTYLEEENVIIQDEDESIDEI
eukprot:gene9310-1398_t